MKTTVAYALGHRIMCHEFLHMYAYFIQGPLAHGTLSAGESIRPETKELNMFCYRDDAPCDCPNCRTTHPISEYRDTNYPRMPDASHRRNDPGIREEIAYLERTGTPKDKIRVVEEGIGHDCYNAYVTIDRDEPAPRIPEPGDPDYWYGKF